MVELEKARTASDPSKLTAAQSKRDQAAQDLQELQSLVNKKVGLNVEHTRLTAEREVRRGELRAALFRLRDDAERSFCDGLRSNRELAMDHHVKDFVPALRPVSGCAQGKDRDTSALALFPDSWVAWAIAHQAAALARSFKSVTVDLIDDLWKWVLPADCDGFRNMYVRVSLQAEGSLRAFSTQMMCGPTPPPPSLSTGYLSQRRLQTSHWRRAPLQSQSHWSTISWRT
jgi:hypothetical protein